jgi:hypothetical protein
LLYYVNKEPSFCGILNFSSLLFLVCSPLVVRAYPQIACSLNGTLRDLKVAISQSAVLGTIPIDRQRVFHLGRELKTLGRSLESLGVGRFLQNGTGDLRTVVHVHVTPALAVLNNPSANTMPETRASRQRQHHPRQRLTETKSRNDEQSKSTVSSVAANQPEVVDLNVDEDDELIVVDELATSAHKNKRRRKK